MALVGILRGNAALEPVAGVGSSVIGVSVLLFAVNVLRVSPKALVITDENDVLRDEGEAYAQKLIEAGVRVTAVRYLGTIHDFVMLNAIMDTPAARSAIGLANANLQRAFAK